MKAMVYCPPESRNSQETNEQENASQIVGRERGGVKLLLDYAYPEAVPGEVLIKVRLAGVCNTDVEITKGYKQLREQIVLGHEFVGSVHAYCPIIPVRRISDPQKKISDSAESSSSSRNTNDKGNVEAHWHYSDEDFAVPADKKQLGEFDFGDRVVAEINCVEDPVSEDSSEEEPSVTISNIGHSKKAHHSERTAVGIFGRDGAFAEYIRVPVTNLHKVPDSVPDSIAVFAEPLAAAAHVTDDIPNPCGSAPSDRHEQPTIAVLGNGKLGLLTAQAVAAHFPKMLVTVIGRRERLMHAAFWSRENLRFKLSKEFDNDSKTEQKTFFDAVIECSGTPEGLSLAVKLTRPRGTIILKSTFSGSALVDLSALVVNEIRVIGSRCGSLANALSLLESGAVDVTELVTAVVDLEKGEEAIAMASDKDQMKVLIEVNRFQQ